MMPTNVMLRLAPLLLLIPSTVFAQGLQLDCYTLDGGGGRASGGGLEIVSSIGQSGSARMTGLDLTIETGFLASCARTSDNMDGTIVDFTATPGAGSNLLSFESQGSASSLQAFELRRRRVSPAGVPMEPFARIQTLNYTGPGSYSTLDSSGVAFVRFEYLVSERFTSGTVVPRATATTIAFAPPSTPIPNTARVGTNGTPYQDVESAIAAATGPSWVVILSPGTYSAFSVNGDAPANLRIVADGLGPVRIDTSLGPISIQDRGLGQGLELRGLEVGDALNSQPAVRVRNSQGVVIMDSCLLQGGLGQPGVELDSATAVALQRCDMRGAPGLLAGNGSVAVAGRGSIEALAVAGQSDVTVSQLGLPSPDVEAGSTLNELGGLMPDLRHLALTSPSADLNMSLTTYADGIFALMLSDENDWAQVSGFEFPLLLSPSLLLTVWSGTASPLGETSLLVDVPTTPGLVGKRFTTQALSYDPATSVLRFSNALSFVVVN